jgi:hypothetical protein
MPRYKLRTLMIAVVWIGLAFASLVTPTPFWVSVVSAITLLSLLTSVLVAVYRRESLRAFALGFLVFGCGYGAFVLLVDARNANAHGPGQETVLPTTRVLGWLYMQYHAKNTRLSPGGGMGVGMNMGGMMPAPKPVAVPRYLYQYFYQAGQFVLTMLIGGLGGIIARFLFLTQPREEVRT